MELRVCSIIRVPDESIGETVIDEIFDSVTSARYLRNHVLSPRCEKFVGRDAGDNLIVIAHGKYQYWDSETDRLIPLGTYPSDFVVGHDE